MAKFKRRTIFISGFWRENPVFRQILGICSALAVTNLLANTLIMGLSLIFVTAMSNLTVSILRNITPPRIRMMVQTLIIASYVIIVDILLKAYLPTISEALGPYVGLIITNCIIMGRCEAFARNNALWPSFVDGVASGCGYAFVLLTIAFFRELMGFGTLFGMDVMPGGWTNWIIMVMPPGAFFMLGAIIWVARSFGPQEEEAAGVKG
ncbi:MAG: NADH:ubiquinone reductase (Na(+)-transporting) subunit D [Thermodesulfobacteriota bacterium]